MKENELKPIGVYTVSNTLSVLIYDIQHGINNERVIYKLNTDKKIRKARIYVNRFGRAYFRYLGTITVYLDEIIKL